MSVDSSDFLPKGGGFPVAMPKGVIVNANNPYGRTAQERDGKFNIANPFGSGWIHFYFNSVTYYNDNGTVRWSWASQSVNDLRVKSATPFFVEEGGVDYCILLCSEYQYGSNSRLVKIKLSDGTRTLGPLFLGGYTNASWCVTDLGLSFYENGNTNTYAVDRNTLAVTTRPDAYGNFTMNGGRYFSTFDRTKTLVKIVRNGNFNNSQSNQDGYQFSGQEKRQNTVIPRYIVIPNIANVPIEISRISAMTDDILCSPQNIGTYNESAIGSGRMGVSYFDRADFDRFVHEMMEKLG